MQSLESGALEPTRAELKGLPLWHVLAGSCQFTVW